MRKEVIYDDLTGQEVEQSELHEVEVQFGELVGTFEGTAESVKALTDLFASQDTAKLRELLGKPAAKPATKKAAKPAAKPVGTVARADRDHSARDARLWCATEPGQAAVKRLGITVPAKGKMPNALIEAMREWQASQA